MIGRKKVFSRTLSCEFLVRYPTGKVRYFLVGTRRF